MPLTYTACLMFCHILFVSAIVMLRYRFLILILDSPHHMVNLDELIKELINIDVLLTTEDKMSAFLKHLSKTVSDFDNETEELLNILHTQHDEQVLCL